LTLLTPPVAEGANGSLARVAATRLLAASVLSEIVPVIV